MPQSKAGFTQSSLQYDSVFVKQDKKIAYCLHDGNPTLTMIPSCLMGISGGSDGVMNV